MLWHTLHQHNIDMNRLSPHMNCPDLWSSNLTSPMTLQPQLLRLVKRYLEFRGFHREFRYIFDHSFLYMCFLYKPLSRRRLVYNKPPSPDSSGFYKFRLEDFGLAVRIQWGSLHSRHSRCMYLSNRVGQGRTISRHIVAQQ